MGVSLDVAVVVATFGDLSWRHLAQQRAVPSGEAQGVPVVQVHGDTLHEGRNAGLDEVATEWVIFLDADDELEAGYIDAMATGSADVRAPAVRYIQAGAASMPRVPTVAGHGHACDAGCLTYGNWLIVGSMARTELLRRAGGWRDFPVYEDWDTWVRCYLAGATFEAIPQAVYRAHVRRNSRNRAPNRAAKLEAHRAIARANGLPVP